MLAQYNGRPKTDVNSLLSFSSSLYPHDFWIFKVIHLLLLFCITYWEMFNWLRRWWRWCGAEKGSTTVVLCSVKGKSERFWGLPLVWKMKAELNYILSKSHFWGTGVLPRGNWLIFCKLILWASFQADTDEDGYLNHWEVLMALKEVALSEALTYRVSKANRSIPGKAWEGVANISNSHIFIIYLWYLIGQWLP